MKKIRRGYFSRLGNIHLHLDGAGASDSVRAVMDRINFEKLPKKMSKITNSILGPQSKEFSSEYDSHNPLSSEDGALDYFATIDISENLDLSSGSKEALIRARSLAVSQLRKILPELVNCHGVVVEVERLVGKLDYDGEWSEIPLDGIAPISGGEVEFTAAPTLPIEIHHAFDVGKDHKEPPISLEVLMDECVKREMTIGGWFSFYGHDQWLYRSNLFVEEASDFANVARRQDAALRGYLDSLGIEYKMKTIAEQVLGIWKFT